MKSGDVLFNKGDSPSEFYFLLKGTVDVYLPKEYENFKEEVQARDVILSK